MEIQDKKKALEALEEAGLFPDPDTISFKKQGFRRFVIFRGELCTKEEFSLDLLCRACKALKAKWTFVNGSNVIRVELPTLSIKKSQQIEERITSAPQEIKEDLCATCKHLGHLKTTCLLTGTFMPGRVNGKCSTYEEKDK